MLLYISKRTNNSISQILVKSRVLECFEAIFSYIDDDAIQDDKSENTITILQERLERMNSATALETALPRKVLLEQLSRILPADDSLPEQVGSI